MLGTAQAPEGSCGFGLHSCIHRAHVSILTLSLHTFLSVVAFWQGCDLIRTLPYARHYSPASPNKVFYWDEKKITWASATPIAGPQCRFEYIHMNVYM